MPARYLFAGVLLFSLTAFAQQSSQGGSSDASSASGPITIEGCITSMNGYFSLATRTGLIRLKGDHDTLFGRNGQQVRVTGTMSSAKKNSPQTLKISAMKKLSDTCQQ
jgi:hypothetical protein